MNAMKIARGLVGSEKEGEEKGTRAGGRSLGMNTIKQDSGAWESAEPMVRPSPRSQYGGGPIVPATSKVHCMRRSDANQIPTWTRFFHETSPASYQNDLGTAGGADRALVGIGRRPLGMESRASQGRGVVSKEGPPFQEHLLLWTPGHAGATNARAEGRDGWS